MANINAFGASPLILSEGGTGISADSTADLLSELLLNSSETITGTDTLTSDDFGKTFICTGATSYVISLPDPTGQAGKIINFIFHVDAGVVVTLQVTIDQFVSRYYGPNEGCTVYSNGTLYTTTSMNLHPVAMTANFSAGGGTVSFVTDTALAVPFNNVVFDSLGDAYDAGTYTYTAKYSGLYTFKTSTWWDPNSSTYGVKLFLYKNGATEISDFVGIVQNNDDNQTIATMGQFTAESGDTFQIFVRQDAGANRSINRNNLFNEFSINRLNNYLP